MTTILDYLDLLLSHPIKVAEEPPKISKPKSVLVRLELNVDSVMYPTTQYYWIPRFLIRSNNYLGSDWKEGYKILRNIREKVIEGEKGCFIIVPLNDEQKYIRETDKAVFVRCRDIEKTEYEMWCPKSLIINDTLIPSWFVVKMKDETDEKGNPRITQISTYKDRVTHNGNIMDYGKDKNDDNIDWDEEDRKFLEDDKELTDEELNDLLADME